MHRRADGAWRTDPLRYKYQPLSPLAGGGVQEGEWVGAALRCVHTQTNKFPLHPRTFRMFSRQTSRLFSSAARAGNKAAKEAATPAYGSFKTFAEYREFIVQKDPEHLAARFKIMMSNGKPEQCPEAEAENHVFGDVAKKVAYNV